VFWKQTRIRSNGKLKFVHQIILVAAVKSDAFVDFGNRVAHQFNRFFAVSAFVFVGALKMIYRVLQMFFRRLHIRLVRSGGEIVFLKIAVAPPAFSGRDVFAVILDASPRARADNR